MDKLLFSTKLLILLFAGALFVSGCSEDEPDRDKFLGAYSVVETCGSGNDSYEIAIISSGTDESAVIVQNLYNAGAQISASVSGNNISIPNQTTGGITYTGSGTISGNILTLNFTVSAGTNSDNCNADATRK